MRKQGVIFIYVFLSLQCKEKVKSLVIARHEVPRQSHMISDKTYPAELTILNYSAFFGKFFSVRPFNFFGNLFEQKFLFHRKFHTR